MTTVQIPGRVWYDALDPAASGMEAALGLPEPTSARRGYGLTFTYADVPEAVARELADYLADRAMTLGGQWGIEPSERAVYRAMAKVAERIRAQLPPAPPSPPRRTGGSGLVGWKQG